MNARANETSRWTVGALLLLIVFSARSQSSAPVEIPFERVSGNLFYIVRDKEFLVVRTSQEFSSLWNLLTVRSDEMPDDHPPPIPYVDFRKSMVIGFFAGHSACEPYRIVRVLEHEQKITVEINHWVWNEVCITADVPSNELGKIPRTDKPVDYEIHTQPPGVRPPELSSN